MTTEASTDTKLTDTKLKSTDTITEPFITLLVEVSWARGRSVREYTMLLDPPVYTPGQTPASNAPVAAPSAGTGAREGSIARESTQRSAIYITYAAEPKSLRSAHCLLQRPCVRCRRQPIS